MSSSTSAGAPGAAPVAAPPGMVQVPAGPFRFGPKGDEVVLGAFWIDLTPVTNAEYAQFVKKTGRRHPSHWSPDGPNPGEDELPVVCVTCEDAEAYAKHLGKLLPTPAQFEKAARGPDGRKYPWGDEVGLRTSNTREAGVGALTPVQRYPRGRSPYGCFDMAGNVLHWTRGLHDKEKKTRVLKGSSFKHYLGASAWSYEGYPDSRQDAVGFRCMWVPA